jgi:UDP-2-acetamido-3-amino-2,3-dideoxy-glucuronate N-acetyltransferase
MSYYFAHPTAIIDPLAVVGNDSKVWHFSHVMKDAVIGERCNIGQNVVVSPGCRVGDGCKIQNNVSVYTGVELEDNVFLGPSMVFTNVFNPRAFIERKNEYRKTLVRRGASVGANATIICGVELGRYCFVGAGAVVTRDVPPYGTVYGNPARLNGFTCWCGSQLHGVNFALNEQMLSCNDCKRAYRRIANGLVEN